MGYMNALGMADAVGDGQVELEQVIAWHLRSNHYPPLPLAMVEPCIEAIDAAIQDDWDHEVELPDGISYRGARSAPVWAIVEGHHLEAFLV